MIWDLLTEHLPKKDSKAWDTQELGKSLRLASFGRVLLAEHDVVLGADAGEYAKHILLAIEALNENGTPLPWRLDGDTCSLLEILGLLHHKKYVGLSTEDAEPPRKKASRRRATTALPSVVRSSLF